MLLAFLGGHLKHWIDSYGYEAIFALVGLPIRAEERDYQRLDGRVVILTTGDRVFARAARPA